MTFLPRRFGAVGEAEARTLVGEGVVDRGAVLTYSLPFAATASSPCSPNARVHTEAVIKIKVR